MTLLQDGILVATYGTVVTAEPEAPADVLHGAIGRAHALGAAFLAATLTRQEFVEGLQELTCTVSKANGTEAQLWTVVGTGEGAARLHLCEAYVACGTACVFLAERDALTAGFRIG